MHTLTQCYIVSMTSASDVPVTVRQARPADAAILARMMTEAISWGRLGQLGPSFVKLLHVHMIKSRTSVCLVADQGGEIVGYIAGTPDTRRFYREFLLRYGWIAAIQLLPRLWQAHNRETIVRGLTHFPDAPKDDSPAEALSFAVRPGLAQRGVGRLLFQALIGELRTRGVAVVKFATVDPANEVGKAFYRKLGCTYLRTDRFYRDTSVEVFVYHIDADHAVSRTSD